VLGAGVRACCPPHCAPGAAQNRGMTVGVVKEMRPAVKDTAAIEEDRKAIQRYQVLAPRMAPWMTALQLIVFPLSSCRASEWIIRPSGI